MKILTKKVEDNLRSKISTKNGRRKSREFAKRIYHQKRVYIYLATEMILKSQKQNKRPSLLCSKLFTKARELSRTVSELEKVKDESEQKSLIRKV